MRMSTVLNADVDEDITANYNPHPYHNAKPDPKPNLTQILSVGVIFRPYGRKISATVCYFPSGTENNVRLYAIFRP